MAGEQATESEPVLLRHLPLGDEQIAGEAGFGGQQIVPGGIPTSLSHIVPDTQKVA